MRLFFRIVFWSPIAVFEKLIITEMIKNNWCFTKKNNHDLIDVGTFVTYTIFLTIYIKIFVFLMHLIMI